MAKMPAFQFYPADWRKSPDVQAMSFFDRGVWFEILCLMHESDERGRLLLAGKPMNDESLMRILGISATKLKNSLHTILSLGVAYRDDEGALCNRRMMRDERLRAVRAASGSLGGNPILLNQNGKQIPTPSSSSSSSTSSSERSKNGETPVAAVAAVDKETDPWTAGITLLKDTMTEAQARPFLGRLAKEYSASEMITAIQATSTEKPADARAFLIAVLKKRAKDKARGQVGKRIPPNAADFTESCLTCFDTGSALVKDSNGKMTGEIDCPECSKPSATSATAADGQERKAAAEAAS